MFTEKDLQQIEKHGLTPDAVERQLENFRRGFPFLKVVRAASPGDGVMVVGDAEAAAAVARYEREADRLGIVKFVPASGAATRMFKELFEFVNEGKRGKGIDTLLDNIGRFAFWPELKAVLPPDADDKATVRAIVKDGLGYGQKPKGLVTFHAYPEGARKAVEEHLVEGAVYAAARGVARIHFTVSPEHIAGFETLLAEKVPVYERRFGIRYDISFSVQKPSTDTIAVNPDNTPFRQDDGTLLFRPAGHGALVENLNEIDADLVFIKNIDNVTTDARRGDTIRYKRYWPASCWICRIGLSSISKRSRWAAPSWSRSWSSLNSACASNCPQTTIRPCCAPCSTVRSVSAAWFATKANREAARSGLRTPTARSRSRSPSRARSHLPTCR